MILKHRRHHLHNEKFTCSQLITISMKMFPFEISVTNEVYRFNKSNRIGSENVGWRWKFKIFDFLFSESTNLLLRYTRELICAAVFVILWCITYPLPNCCFDNLGESLDTSRAAVEWCIFIQHSYNLEEVSYTKCFSCFFALHVGMTSQK